MKEEKVPYLTGDDESQWIGHVWAQRDRIGGQWGFAYAVYPPYSEDPEVSGWRADASAAFHAMRSALAEKQGGKK